MLEPLDRIYFYYGGMRHEGIVVSHSSVNQRGETDWRVRFVSRRAPFESVCVACSLDFDIQWIGRDSLEELLTHQDVRYRRAGIEILQLQKDFQCV